MSHPFAVTLIAPNMRTLITQSGGIVGWRTRKDAETAALHFLAAPHAAPYTSFEIIDLRTEGI